MGNCVGGFRRQTTRISPWKKNRTFVICFLGVDGAGKTTVVKALQGEDLGSAMPTVGFSRAEFSLKKHRVVAYDLGGGERIREIWSTYYAEVYGIVYVVDSAAAARFAENMELVNGLVERAELMHKPILFLLNKKDLPGAVDEMEFSERFQLHEMAKRNKTDIRVEGICAVKGTGKEMDLVIGESMEWLVDRINANYSVIDKGVTAALKVLRERQAQDRLERQHRLAEISAYKTEEHSEENNNSRRPTSLEVTRLTTNSAAEANTALSEVPSSSTTTNAKTTHKADAVSPPVCNGTTASITLLPVRTTAVSSEKIASNSEMSDRLTSNAIMEESRPSSAQISGRGEVEQTKNDMFQLRDLRPRKGIQHRSKSLCYATNKVTPHTEVDGVEKRGHDDIDYSSFEKPTINSVPLDCVSTPGHSSDTTDKSSSHQA